MAKKKAPDHRSGQGPQAPSAHHRPGYPLLGCVPAEPNSVSPGGDTVIGTQSGNKSKLAIGQKKTRKRPEKAVLNWDANGEF